NYMSLYGYPLDTTPKLKQHQLNGNLYVFNDIISPHSHTNTSIAKIFTFSNYENEEIHWYKQKNIIDIMKRVGYYTYWISNQESISSFGNAPEAIARRADYTIFLDRMFTGNSITKDENISR
ncbi:sulfatase-like hydrolase/transferase, partial [Campylobacter lari]|nr:sulfatase-like hydrolase/transferase [Campylobacter lari]